MMAFLLATSLRGAAPGARRRYRLDMATDSAYNCPMNKYLIFLVLAAAPLLWCSISSAQLIYLPANDPMVSRLEELQNRGYLDGLSRSEKPWVIADIASEIIDDEWNFDPASKKIASDILDYLTPPQRSESELLSGGVVWGVDLRGFSRERREGYFYTRDLLLARDFKNELGSVYHSNFWLSKESRWGFDSELIFDSDGTLYPWYYGTPHNARIIGQFDRAYMTFELERLRVLLGRQRLVWGPSSRGSLLLNDSSPPLDMLGYNFSLSPFNLTGFSTRLDDYIDQETGEVNRRFMSGHRIRLNPGAGLEIALSEIYVYGGPDRLPEAYYNIPIILYYWEQQNRNLDDNAMWGLDISWIRSAFGKIYTQFAFDDIQRQHRGPQKFGMQFGVELRPKNLPKWSGLIELNLIDTYAYGQRKRLNAYLNNGWPIGRLDSDQREYFASLSRRFGDNLKMGIEFVGRDKGENDAADIQPGMAPFGIKFPSGIVEETKNISLSTSFHSKTIWDSQLSVGYETIRNYRHVENWSLDQFFITANISIKIKTGIPFWKESP
jgi:hypothetical protein